ncbi:DUF1428 domain-containing protein [Bradyrhizobium sp.]|uniref:DUF1428 domain-containing protein n=1 Tax=Bradyrhizobium sp. TaxID=376 RepID=UPI000B2B309D|nr:DUF1428 domain-containing protein [Bradyrhizobium sp.]
MPYVDGFVVAVPKKNLDAYSRLAKKAGKIWREYGALDYHEWVADDVKVGKLTSFPRAVKLKPGETVVFSWITYKSRAQRDKINAKVMADPRLANMMDPKAAPFDGKRMIYGGFESLVKV